MMDFDSFDGSCPTCGQTDKTCPPIRGGAAETHDDPPVAGGYTGGASECQHDCEALGTHKDCDLHMERPRPCSCEEALCLKRAIERIRMFTKDHEIGESSKLARIREVCASALGSS